MKKIFFTFLFLMLTNITWSAPITNLPIAPTEAWVKLTCVGPTTPVNVYPVVMTSVFTAFFQVDKNEPFPTMEALRNSKRNDFDTFHKLCHEKRIASVNLSGFTGLWLDWGTDYGYAYVEIGEQFVYGNQCRSQGSPCATNSQCCSSQNLICDLDSHSCRPVAAKGKAPIQLNRAF